ncbi:Asp-tRNA(Asn)/Glu-tRNA(Gln) amidotransferase GatCAB subunit A [Candidatus Falkowbacteria bacterium CG11_big_fil_rev_8_21_14_0_20_39_10]|uniref:Glutamyl-tRNA(Gln) amidotransferase subunit A n=1 Tax=Candidatus Falkowbacteria bacterium CG11_big_fil_rev_8_21_14_0_20_39_10 TaxID=1974570 RepID=A0A2M6K7X6_9BACT|nr:MAG: Asp-tRNA(Asn)/Glu-tRNA(Gln) amidotransferase GatCAB subunit A [Candidatus Falkowbacteria bacterium CG11_big_fil_rev_8_21_14_0_20_39_10]
MKLNQLTIKEASKLLQEKKITSVELTKACLARIKEVDGKIKACLTVCEKEALAEAKRADEMIKRGEKSELLGIPYIAKDNILTKGIRTTAASKILENYIAPFDATIIKKLKKAGAVLLAKANLDEFAHGASTENSAYGPTHNPWDLTRVAGGSSGGPAAAVAADMCIFALGTDTGGSIRCPASFCSVVGLKPTYGRSSRFGLMAMTSSTDVPGPITKTVEDAAIILKAMAGHDKNDATTPAEKVPDYCQELSSDSELSSLKIGVPEEFFQGADKGVKEAVEKAIEKLKDLGAKIIPIKLPHAKYGIPVYYIITPSEVSSNLARFDGIKYGLSVKESKDLQEVYFKSRGKGFGPEAKRRIMLGTYALSAGYFDAYYLQAQKVRTIIKNELDSELKKLDAIATPVQPGTAFKIGEQVDDPLKMYLEDLFVAPASLAGLPAISVPAGFSKGLPVGMQIIGRRFDEGMLFRIGHQFEKATKWHEKKPVV